MAHSDIHPLEQPRRRLGALVLVRDRARRVLLVKPTYKPGWQLPGGAAHENEPIATAAARELAEETGLYRRVSHYLVVDQVPANPDTRVGEGFNVVCDGGIVSRAETETLAVPEHAADEIADVAWANPRELGTFARPYQRRRIAAALDALDAGMSLPLMMLGLPQ